MDAYPRFRLVHPSFTTRHINLFVHGLESEPLDHRRVITSMSGPSEEVEAGGSEEVYKTSSQCLLLYDDGAEEPYVKQ